MPSKPIRELGLRESILAGISWGIEAWTAYAVVECLFSSVLPWIMPLFRGYADTSDSFTIFITVLYIAGGAVFGAAVGAAVYFAAGKSDRLSGLPSGLLFRTLAVSSVVASLLVNFAYYSDSYFPVVLSSVWLVLTIAGAFSASAYRRLSAFTNPWTASAILLGVQWMGWELMDGWALNTRIVVYATYVAGAVLTAVIIQKIVNGGKTAFAAATCALAVVLTLAVVLDQNVLTAEAEATTARAAGHPNVILISLDTLRADHLSLYGYDRRTTPNLEKFARDCVVYNQAVSAGDMTLSSHASMFTGLYPSRHGAHLEPDRGIGVPLSASIPTLPEILSHDGYHSDAVVANFAYLSPAFGFARGFEQYDSRSDVPFLAESRQFYLRARVRNYMTRWVPQSVSEHQTRYASEINEAAFDVLGQHRPDHRPFFLFINYMDAHLPYLPPAPYDTLYPGKAPRFTGSQYASIREDVLSRRREITPAERNHLISQYDGAINYLDDQLGEFLSGLQRMGLYDNTLIILTGDHGEAFGERHLMEHGVSVYQDQVHVPLMIKYPRGVSNVAPGTRINAPTSLVNLLPTILDAVKFPIPSGLDGESLLAHPVPNRTVYAESFPNQGLIDLQPAFRRVERAVYSGPMKLIDSTAGKRELYDLQTDPAEHRNMYLSAATPAKDLETRLSQWVKAATGHSLGQASSTADRGAVERLKSLGYVQ